MARIEAIATSLHHSQTRAGWPRPGEVDPRLSSIADDLDRATDLVIRRARADQPLRPAAARDVDAARTRLLHTVYLSAHGVTLGLRDYTAEMTHRLDTRRQIPPGDSLTQARRALERIGTAERLAGAYLAGRWPAAVTGEHRDPPAAGRLPVALAIWDLQAHRTLAATPTIGNLLYVAHVQRDIAVSAQLVNRSAADTLAIDASQFHGRLQPALDNLESAWSHLSGLLHQLASPPQRRVDPPLLNAGNEVRAAIREVTHEGSGPRSSERMAQAADVAEVSRALHVALGASIDLAHLARDIATAPGLVGAARGVQAIATDRTAASHPVAAWVDAADLHHNRAIALADPVRDALAQGVDHAIRAATTADSAGSFLERGVATVAPGAMATPSSESRRPEERTTHDMALGEAGAYCER